MKTISVTMSINKKLLFAILAASTIVTAIKSGAMYYVDYKKEIHQLNKIKDDVNLFSAAGISQSLWEVNSTAIKRQLEGLTNNRNVVYIELKDEKDQLVEKVYRNGNLDVDKFHVIKLRNPSNYETDSLPYIGTLKIAVTYKYVQSNLISRIGTFLISQFLKTLILSLVILFLIHKLLTKHILKLTRSIVKKTYEVGNIKRPILLNRRSHKTDEIDQLTDALNEMDSMLIDLLREKEQRSLVLKEQKDRAEIKAVESARWASIGSLAGGLAHEINNPLAVIDGYIALLGKSEISDIEIQLKIKEMTNRISKITNSLIIFSGSRGKSVGTHQNTNVWTLIDDSLILINNFISTNNIKVVTLPLERQPIFIICAVSEVMQVLNNILQNALEAIERSKNIHKFIRLEVSQEKSLLSISIIDSGEGFTALEKEQAFNPFYSTKTIGEGLGLGLSLSKSIAESIGARIEIGTDDNGNTKVNFIINLKNQDNLDKENNH